MAKITSPFHCSGAIGDTVFTRRNGAQFAYMKPAHDRDKWRNNPKGQLSHLYAQEFGGAAMYACAIYNALKSTNTRGLIKPYAHNHIAGRIRRHIHTAKGFSDHYQFQDAVHALQNLDLSRKESKRGNGSHRRVREAIHSLRHPTDYLTFLPIGPKHCPTHVRIQGLRDAAQAIDPTNSRQLEFRVTRKNIRFPEISYDAQSWKWNKLHQDHNLLADSHTTLWVPVDCIPQDGIRLSLVTKSIHTEPQDPEACFFIIEWRELKPKQKPRKLKDHAVIRLATIRTSVAQAKDLPITQTTTERRRHYTRRPTQARRKGIKKANPALYLRIALGTG
jgi:hypothetical protein